MAELLLEFGVDGSATITGGPGEASAERALSAGGPSSFLDYRRIFDSPGGVSTRVTSGALDILTRQDLALSSILELAIVQDAPGTTTIEFAHTARLARIDLLDPSTGQPLTGVTVTDGLGNPIPINQDLLGTTPEPASAWLLGSAILAGIGYKLRQRRRSRGAGPVHSRPVSRLAKAL